MTEKQNTAALILELIKEPTKGMGLLVFGMSLGFAISEVGKRWDNTITVIDNLSRVNEVNSKIDEINDTMWNVKGRLDVQKEEIKNLRGRIVGLEALTPSKG